MTTQLELAALGCVRWFKAQLLLEPIGNIPPMEAEAKYFSDQAGAQARGQGITLTK